MSGIEEKSFVAEIAEALPIRRRVYAPVDTLVHEELSRKALIMNSMHSLSMNHDAIFLSLKFDLNLLYQLRTQVPSAHLWGLPT